MAVFEGARTVNRHVRTQILEVNYSFKKIVFPVRLAKYILMTIPPLICCSTAGYSLNTNLETRKSIAKKKTQKVGVELWAVTNKAALNQMSGPKSIPAPVPYRGGDDEVVAAQKTIGRLREGGMFC